jgi:hypothetical protein
MRRHFATMPTLLPVLILAVIPPAFSASLDPAQATELITNTADRICNVVLTHGEARSSEVRGEIKAQLSGLASKLADAGVSGAGSIVTEKYENVLRQDLASMLNSNAQCKLRVFEDLQSKLIPNSASEKNEPSGTSTRDTINSTGDCNINSAGSGNTINNSGARC